MTRDYKLTELLNKYSLSELYEHYLEVYPRSSFSIIITDVDFFKKYNDKHGHIKGDECLEAIAGILGKAAKDKRGIPGRWGGEEFVIIFPGKDKAEVNDIAQIIIEDVKKAAIYHGDSCVADHVTLSIGTYTFDSEAETVSLEDAIGYADCALYGAKKTGRNKAVQYDGKLSMSM